MMILAFTDGACSGNPGPFSGGAVLLAVGANKLIRRGEASWYFGNEGTNNLAELLAIKNVILRVDEERRQHVHLAVFTDSEYAVKVINGSYSASSNAQVVAAIRQMAAQFKSFIIYHMPNRADDPNQQEAHKLAGKALKTRSDDYVVTDYTGQLF